MNSKPQPKLSAQDFKKDGENLVSFLEKALVDKYADAKYDIRDALVPEDGAMFHGMKKHAKVDGAFVMQAKVGDVHENLKPPAGAIEVFKTEIYHREKTEDYSRRQIELAQTSNVSHTLFGPNMLLTMQSYRSQQPNGEYQTGAKIEVTATTNSEAMANVLKDKFANAPLNINKVMNDIQKEHPGFFPASSLEAQQGQEPDGPKKKNRLQP